MTEHQREDDLLAELLDLPEGSEAGHHAAHIYSASSAPAPEFTRRDERALLSEANQVGTPTLSPDTTSQAGTSESFAGELGGLVRRYPIPAMLAGAALMFVLARRRR